MRLFKGDLVLLETRTIGRNYNAYLILGWYWHIPTRYDFLILKKPVVWLGFNVRKTFSGWFISLGYCRLEKTTGISNWGN